MPRKGSAKAVLDKRFVRDSDYYRSFYDEIFEVRVDEMELAEKDKTLKTKTFVLIEEQIAWINERFNFRGGNS